MDDRPEIPMPDHQIYKDAADALRLYHEARDHGAPDDEVERLRLIAEAQIKAASTYHLSAAGYQPIDRQ